MHKTQVSNLQEIKLSGISQFSHCSYFSILLLFSLMYFFACIRYSNFFKIHLHYGCSAS